MADTAPPPPDVLLAFVRVLNETVGAFGETLVPVVRGSLLLRLWFGDEARPPADLDLECFTRPLTPEEVAEFHADYADDYDDEEGEPVPPDGTRGRRDMYDSPVDFGKAMCRYAARSGEYLDRRPLVRFEEVRDVPPDGASLYVYGTPGERYYTGWDWPGRGSGRIQIDVSAGGSYGLAGASVAPVRLTQGGDPVDCPAYTPEMLLAAKVSWLVRSLSRTPDGRVEWKGEPKDLFDAHLLLTRGALDAGVFRRALLAVGAQDRLAWNGLDAVLAGRHGTVPDAVFGNWPSFRARYGELVDRGPGGLFREVAEHLEPLLGDFYSRDEMPFLLAVNAGPADELPHLVYSDWLDENGHVGRAEVVRRYVALRGDRPAELRDVFAAAPLPWLCQLLGTSARVDELRGRAGELF